MSDSANKGAGLTAGVVMLIIHRYIARETLKFFTIVLTAVVSIYLAVDFFQKIDDFILAGIPMARMISFFLLKTPLVVSQVAPICILLAVLIAFGLMNNNNEIVALKSSGVNIYILLKPILFIGLFCSLCLFLLTEMIVPVTISRANRIWRQEVRKKSALTSKQKNIWIKGYRSIYYITYYNPQTKSISGITFNYFDDDFKLIKKVDAKHGSYENGRWTLFDSMVQVRDKNTGIYDVSFHEKQVVDADFLPEDLKRVIKNSEEMNFKELYAYIQAVKFEGYDATLYRVNFHAKFTILLVCVLFSIFGTGIAVKRRVREGLWITIAHGIGMFFLYWVSQSVCLSLGYGGQIPPIIAAWIANIVFFGLGLFYLINAE
jgi:lipopolysaccharide export system permease protein